MTDGLNQPQGDTAMDRSARIRQRAVKRIEGVAALSVLTGMRQCISALESMLTLDDSIARSVLFSGLIVSYARAFEGVTDTETQTARSFGVKRLSAPFDRALHDAILSLRNEQIAHAGHALNDYSLTFMAFTVNSETRQPNGTVTRSEKRHIIGTRARASLALGPATTDVHEKLLAHLSALEDEASRRLAVAIIEHDAASLFRLEEQTENGEVWASLHTRNIEVEGQGLLIAGEEDLAISLAKAPDALPLAFAVTHYNLVAEGEDLTLKGMIVKE